MLLAGDLRANIRSWQWKRVGGCDERVRPSLSSTLAFSARPKARARTNRRKQTASHSDEHRALGPPPTLPRKPKDKTPRLI